MGPRDRQFIHARCLMATVHDPSLRTEGLPGCQVLAWVRLTRLTRPNSLLAPHHLALAPSLAMLPKVIGEAATITLRNPITSRNGVTYLACHPSLHILPISRNPLTCRLILL